MLEEIHFLTNLKREKKLKIESLEAEVSQSVQQHDAHCNNIDMISHYPAKINFLQVELNEVYLVENAKARAYNTVRKYFQHEHSIKYYFRQPGRKYDSVKRIHTPQGCVVTDPQKVMDTCVNFYTELYTQEFIPYLFKTHTGRKDACTTL